MKPTKNSSTLSPFWRGVLDTTPLLLACMPVAIVFGALALHAGMSSLGAIGMSVFVFAGSSQFVAISLLTLGSPLLVIIISVFFVNLRHMLYSISWMPEARQETKWRRIPMAFWMTDETFAVVSRFRQTKPGHEPLIRYFWGSAIAMYLNWVAFTVVGVWLGKTVPNMTEWGLDIAMILTFTAIVVPALKHRAHILCAVVAIICAIITYDWPYKSGLLFSSLIAIVIGAWCEQRWDLSPIELDEEND